MCKLNSQTGVTLIELMITVAIISIISAIAVPAYNSFVITSNFTECSNEIAAIRLAEVEFSLNPVNNSFFTGNGAADIAAKSENIYVPSAKALDPLTTNCTYTVAAGICGNIANCYTITATGVNSLAGQGTTTVNGP